MRLPDHPRDRFRVWTGLVVAVLSLLLPLGTLAIVAFGDFSESQRTSIWSIALSVGTLGAFAATKIVPDGALRRDPIFLSLFALTYGLTFAAMALAGRL